MVINAGPAGRLRVVPIWLGLLPELVRTGATPRDFVDTCAQGVPADAKLVDAQVDKSAWELRLVFEHSSWDEVLHGQVIPVLDVTYRRELVPAADEAFLRGWKR